MNKRNDPNLNVRSAVDRTFDADVKPCVDRFKLLLLLSACIRIYDEPLDLEALNESIPTTRLYCFADKNILFLCDQCMDSFSSNIVDYLLLRRDYCRESQSDHLARRFLLISLWHGYKARQDVLAFLDI